MPTEASIGAKASEAMIHGAQRLKPVDARRAQVTNAEWR
jgi:hypothetical protein